MIIIKVLGGADNSLIILTNQHYNSGLGLGVGGARQVTLLHATLFYSPDLRY